MHWSLIRIASSLGTPNGATDGKIVSKSYRTAIAFRAPGTGVIVRQNDWGPTTGKHLNVIDGGDKKSRVTSDEFERRFAEALQGSHAPTP